MRNREVEFTSESEWEIKVPEDVLKKYGRGKKRVYVFKVYSLDVSDLVIVGIGGAASPEHLALLALNGASFEVDRELDFGLDYCEIDSRDLEKYREEIPVYSDFKKDGIGFGDNAYYIGPLACFLFYERSLDLPCDDVKREVKPKECGAVTITVHPPDDEDFEEDLDQLRKATEF